MSQLGIRTYAAKVDMSEKKGYAVYITTDAKINNTPVVNLCTANETKVMGIVVDPSIKAEAGLAVGVATSGFHKALIGASVTAGVPLKANTVGKLVPATSDKDHVIAVAQEAASSGAFIEVEIKKYDLAV